MQLGDVLTLVYTHIGTLYDVASWTWIRPKVLLLLLLVPLFANRALGTREALYHGAFWLFEPPALARFGETFIRQSSRFLASAILILLILSLGGPTIQKNRPLPNQNRPALVYVVDMSGSMGGIFALRLTTFLTEFVKAADGLRGEKRIGVGLYYFASFPLLNVAPTPSYRMLSGIVKRFNTGSYGAGTGTEPSPSLWMALLDLARMSDPQLATKLQHLRKLGLFSCKERGMRDDPEAFARHVIQIYNTDVLAALRSAMLGKRMVLGTDTDFDLTSMRDDLCMTRLFRFAAAINLPIDIVSTNPMSNAVAIDFPPLVRSTKGNLYILSSSFSGAGNVLSEEEKNKIGQAVRSVYESLTTSAVWREQESHRTLDSAPQRAILALAFILAIAWVVLRALRPIVGW